MKTAEIKSFLE